MADRSKQPVQGDWVTIARRARPREEKIYVVFTGFQPGIYKTWEECHPQVNNFPGACYKSYDSMTKARRAWYSRPPMVSAQQMEFTPPMVIPPVRPIGVPMNILSEPEIKDFYNPGIPSPVYEHLNAVWKGHVSGVKAKFRQGMAGLADELAKQAEELSNIKRKQNVLENLCFQIIKQMDWTVDFNFEKINNFLQLSDLIANEFPDPIFEKIKRICLYEKARSILPPEIFMQIHAMVEDHQRKIKHLLLNEKDRVNFREDIPKTLICLNHDDWTDDEITWGVTNEIIFQILDPTYWTSFPMMIRTMPSCVASTYTWNKYFTFWISSSVGWRERERFYQPYQIWYFKPTEDWEFEQETNPLHSKFVIPNLDPEEYWIESLLRLSQHAAQIQGTVPTPFMVTDGRRIFVTNFPISYERTEEQIQEVEALLNNIKKRQNLDLPMELTIQADSVEEDRNMQFSQDPYSPVTSEHYDGVEYQNLINQMED